MPTPEIRAQVAERLEALYERHRPVDGERLDRYYESGRGYYPPEEAGEERDRFAICLATPRRADPLADDRGLSLDPPILERPRACATSTLPAAVRPLHRDAK